MDEKAVTDLLKRAVAAVDASGATGELREPAFNAALALLTEGLPATSRAGVVGQQTASQPPPPQPSQLSPTKSSGSSVLDGMSAALSLDLAAVRRIYAEKDGEPELIIKSSKLPSTKAAGARDIALLVMLARQIIGIDDYTAPETIRDACKRYGKFDSSNFGAHLKSLDNMVLTRGKGQSTSRKLTHPGIEYATELLEKYASEA